MGEEVLILASRIKKKDSTGKVDKSSVDNKSYFHKQETFLITIRQKIDKKYFYWLKSTRNEKNKIKYRYQRIEILTISNNFNWNLHRF